jgi:hypothetical protein
MSARLSNSFLMIFKSAEQIKRDPHFESYFIKFAFYSQCHLTDLFYLDKPSLFYSYLPPLSIYPLPLMSSQDNIQEDSMDGDMDVSYEMDEDNYSYSEESQEESKLSMDRLPLVPVDFTSVEEALQNFAAVFESRFVLFYTKNTN